MNREILKVTKNQIEDYTSYEDVTIKGDEFKFIEQFLVEGDGETHKVIYQRTKDGKYFEYEWSYDSGMYYYEPEWYETKIIKQIVKNEYGWN